MYELKATLSSSSSLTAKLMSGNTLSASFGGTYIRDLCSETAYDGEYVVIPSTEKEQILNTAKKTMKQDVTVLKVPYFEVLNNSGGITASIGNEV